MKEKCGACGASTRFLDQTLFSRGGLIMPAEIRLCPQCESTSISVIDKFGVQGSAVEDGPAFFAKRLRIEKHGELLEVMCPRCEASMFFVQHSNVSFGEADILAESWICECGTTLETAKDPDIA